MKKYLLIAAILCVPIVAFAWGIGLIGGGGGGGAAPAGCSGTMDFTDVEWVETDSGSDITKTDADTITIDTMAGGAISSVTYDCGTDSLDPLDLSHDIDFIATASTGALAIVSFWTLSDMAVPTETDQDAANDGIRLFWYDAGGTGNTFVLKDFTDDESDQVVWGTISASTQYYFRIIGSGSTLVVSIYTNPNRTDGLVDTLTISPTATTYDYLSAVSSLDYADVDTVSALVENLIIN